MRQKAKEAGTLPDGRYIHAGEVFDWGSALPWAEPAGDADPGTPRSHPTEEPASETQPEPEPEPGRRSGGKPTQQR